jgi:DNA-binding NarL/FixJ family response regulator
MKKTSIAIADDHKIFAEGIQSVTKEIGWLNWVGQAYSAKETLALYKEKRPDVLLLDYHLPDSKGVDVAREILKENPAAIILMLSMENDNDIIYQCKTVGVMGYLIKNLSSDELLSAIEEAISGKTVFMWSAEKPAAKPQADVLSKREKEIIQLIRQGLTSHEIANKLFLSTYTVDTHRRNILRKLDLKNTAMMVLYAQQHQL